MTEQTGQTKTQRISPVGIIIGVAAALLVMGWLLLRGDERPLKPFRPTATPSELTVNSQPILVTFDQLNGDPNAFRGQRIRVTGSYAPQEKPDCFDYSGPDIRWALVSGDLQLHGFGFEEILQLVPNGTTLTVDGVWQYYDGPVGCGKGPARELIWYLQIERIVQPNPLPNFGPIPETDGTEPDETPLPDDATAVPGDDGAEEGTAVPLPTSQSTPELGTTPTSIPTATPTLSAETTITPSPTSTTISDGPTRPSESSPTATATPRPDGTATSTATTTPDILSTPGTTTPTRPPLITGTPGATSTPGTGYPGPTETAPPTSYP